MWIDVISLFPKMFDSIKNYGITKKAIKKKLITIRCLNPRDFSNKYSIDDYPYGGGPGMLIKAQPLYDTVKEAKKNLPKNTKIIYLSPQGKLLNQENIKKIMLNKTIILICGRYEGIDERFISTEVDEEWSIGNYVISGGEIAAMVLIDAISRLIPGVLGNLLSVKMDSLYTGLLSYPKYTRPRILNGIEVPPVLLSGNHKKINIWKMKQSLGRTWIKRPDLLKKLNLSNEQIKLLIEFKKSYI